MRHSVLTLGSIRATAGLLLIALFHPDSGSLPCMPRRSQFSDSNSLYHQVAIIGPDNREDRTPEAFGENVEAAQARVWCHRKGSKPKGSKLNKSQVSLKNFSVSNATLAFEDGMAIVSRHIFVDEYGKQDKKFTDCFLELIKSGEIIRVEDAVYPEMKTGNTSFQYQDFAVVRLASAPKGGIPIKEKDIAINPGITPGEDLKVVSNVASNNKNGNIEALTMTTCQSHGRYKMNGARVPVHGTDCDTGDGSSGAQVYAQRDGQWKFAAVVSDDLTDAPAGGEFDPKRLSTIVTEFDDSLIESYNTLKSRRGI